MGGHRKAPLVVAIDGPGGVGKSTVSRRVAADLGAAHLDTGAFYRAATLAVLEAGADPSDSDEVSGVAQHLEIDQRHGRFFLGERDVTNDIRTDTVTAAVSAVSSHPPMRSVLVKCQQEWVRSNGGRAVVEGRDIGTVVFPDAALKIYLDADPTVRAARRSSETGAAPQAVAEALARRDRTDSTRQASPLTVAEDAVVIDTTEMTIAEVVAQVLSLLSERGLLG